ncbi:MAG TPA: DUF692 domain-containing protein [Thiobacillaceae bacterium]|nr:DUF692 domain-containing protein [Thiobacillaceae bacterium]
MKLAGVNFTPDPVPAQVGVGLRSPHYRDMLERLPKIGFLEVHSENYFGAGGQPHYFLQRLRDRYPLSLHGVGLSLGSAEPINMAHLRRLKTLTERYQPGLVSEHLCWSSVAGRHLNDLLPLPYTEEALAVVAHKLSQAQDYLGRQILLENISSYLEFTASDIPEWRFLAELVKLSGCGILLDVNNIYVNAVNHGYDAAQFIMNVPREAVQEIHLAGFDRGVGLLIDTHGKPVHDDVWNLYRLALQRFGRLPTLIEWDTDIPALDVLLGEANKAKIMLQHEDFHADAA